MWCSGDVGGDTSFVISRRTTAYECRKDPSNFMCIGGLAQFSGDDAMVDQMIAECHKGPPAARVDEVRVVPESGNPVPGFKVLPAE